MKQDIIIYNQHNNKTGTTFKRRAYQLVLAKKAIWSDNTQSSIILCESNNLDKEDNNMDVIKNNDGTEFIDLREHEHKEAILSEEENDKLYKMAKQNVEGKNELIIHAISFFVFSPIPLLFGLFIANDSNFLFLAFLAIVGWFGGLCIHTASYFISKNNQKAILKEYTKLKK